VYDLAAVVVHLGSAFGGHYVCYRRAPRVVSREEADGAKRGQRAGNKGGNGPGPDPGPGMRGMPWVRCSDRDVRPCSWEEVGR